MGKAGGELLNVLRGMAEVGGDERRAELLAFLEAKAAEPYLEMLRRWVYEGLLDDPYREFMVAEEEGITKETVAEDFTTLYWERRYQLRRSMVASFLLGCSDKVAKCMSD